MRSSLALYRDLLPRFKMRKWDTNDPAYILLHALDTVAIFDCRLLPPAFVDDTGDAVFEELQETGETNVYLPGPRAYFEFADAPRVIYANSNQIYSGHLDAETIDDDPTPDQLTGHSIEIYDLTKNAEEFGAQAEVAFGNCGLLSEGDPVPFFGSINSDEPDSAWEPAAKRVLAIIALLTEELVLQRDVPDPMPRVSKERKRTQKLPISGDSHILTINVPIVRYVAARTLPQGGSHASPALHWRRGHKRIYHRGEVAETEGWVRRCLVGDPAAGYIRITQYRLVHRPMSFRVIEGGKKT